MKTVIFTGVSPVLHTEAGIIKPGPNQIANDQLADRLLAAGEITGQFVSPGAAGVVVQPSAAGVAIVAEAGESEVVTPAPGPKAAAKKGE